MEISAHEDRKVVLHVLDGPKVRDPDGTVKQIRKVIFDTSIFAGGDTLRYVYACTDGGTTIWNGKRAALRLLREAGYDVWASDLTR